MHHSRKEDLHLATMSCGRELLSLGSTKQASTALSTCEAEIYALSDTLADARLLQWKMIDIKMKVPDKIIIKVDNNQANPSIKASATRLPVDTQWADYQWTPVARRSVPPGTERSVQAWCGMEPAQCAPFPVRCALYPALGTG